jgi:hypothetical protein
VRKALNSASRPARPGTWRARSSANSDGTDDIISTWALLNPNSFHSSCWRTTRQHLPVELFLPNHIAKGALKNSLYGSGVATDGAGPLVEMPISRIVVAVPNATVVLLD